MAAGIEFSEAVVIKRGLPELMRVEAEKMTRAREIGEASGLFTVPRLLDFDDVTGKLTMEWIPGLTGLRRARLNRPDLVNFTYMVGRSLAAVHAKLDLPFGPRTSLAPPWASNVRRCFIHGDVSTENVCYSSANPGKPVLIDWQTTARHGGEATYDTGYFDVAWFMSNLFHVPFYRAMPGRLIAAARSFLEGYFGNDDAAFEEFRDYHRMFFVEKMKMRRASMGVAKRVVLSRGASLWQETIEHFGRG